MIYVTAVDVHVVILGSVDRIQLFPWLLVLSKFSTTLGLPILIEILNFIHMNLMSAIKIAKRQS